MGVRSRAAQPTLPPVLMRAILDKRLALAPGPESSASALALGGAARLRLALGMRSPSSSAALRGCPVPDLEALRARVLAGDPGVAKTSCRPVSDPHLPSRVNVPSQC